MNSRERVIRMLNGEKTDRFPVDLWYTDEISIDLKNYFKVENDFDLYRAMGLDKIVWVSPEYKNPSQQKSTGSQVGGEANYSMTPWGVPLKLIRSGKAVYQEIADAPLKDYNSIGSLEDYPYWPDCNLFEYEKALKKAKEFSKDYVTLGPWISFFEIYCQMRGLQQGLMDLVLEPGLANAILDRIENCQTQMLNKYLTILGNHLDMVFISDDMGMQGNLLISPDIWDKFFKARMIRWCQLVHSYNKKVFYHSDGAVEPLISRWIECGIDVLNPIQHACNGMDMDLLKRKYGDKIIFHGGVDNQSVLPFGSPEDVVAETKHCINTLGSDGKGYIVCSCHNVQAGTPVENIIAMIETVINR